LENGFLEPRLWRVGVKREKPQELGALWRIVGAAAAIRRRTRVSVESVRIPADNGFMGDANTSPETDSSAPRVPPPHEGGDPSEVLDTFATLEKEIENLKTPARDAARSAGAQSRDDLVAPLLKEINEILSHETNALLSSTNGLLGKTLESIFDPKTLAKKHEKIDKALAQALSKNKVGMPKAAPKPAAPAVPAPRMAPKAAEEAGKVVEEKRTDEASGSVKVEAGPEQVESVLKVEAVAEQADTVLKVEAAPEEVAGSIKVEAAPEQVEAKVTVEKAPVEAEPAAKPEPEQEKPAEIKLEKPKEQPKEQPKQKSKDADAAALADDADKGPSLLVRILSYPMRFVPENAKLIVSALALTMLFAMPVAWALAMRSAAYEGIGPIDFTQVADAEAAEAASEQHAAKGKAEKKEDAAAPAKDADSKSSGDAKKS
jgi:hypothetical protein